MIFALSTNWCSGTIESGTAIAEKALELGFGALELGFRTTPAQAEEIRRMRDRIPVGSVHAFCPVPISAPQGHPELYQLASLDEETRRMARFQIAKNVRFAAEVGADALVLHLGRVMCGGWLKGKDRDLRRRVARGRKMADIAKRELEALVPELERARVTLGLENLPYLEGFPGEWEIAGLCGDWVRPWLDTGHDHVRSLRGWKAGAPECPPPVGLHVNDSAGGDDHLAPGAGQIDFAALRPLAAQARHLVLEPAPSVGEAELRASLDFLRKTWT